MVLSLSEILSTPNKALEMDIPLENRFIEFQGERYEWIDRSDFHMKITNQGQKKILLEGTTVCLLSMPCSRCLDSVKVTIPVEIYLPLDFSRKEEESIRELEEEGCLNGYDLDVDLLVRDEVIVALPDKVVCKADCKGLCPVCGNNLNLGECGCNRTSFDPRMAAFQDIFNNFKEV